MCCDTGEEYTIIFNLIGAISSNDGGKDQIDFSDTSKAVVQFFVIFRVTNVKIFSEVVASDFFQTVLQFFHL